MIKTSIKNTFKCLIVVLAVFMFVLAGFSSPAFSQDNTRRLGLGYEGIFMGDYLSGISLRYWSSDRIGFEGNIFHARIGIDLEDVGDADLNAFIIGAKALYATVVKQNSKFYLGLEAGYGKADIDDVSEDLDLLIVSPLFGAEYCFGEIPELGFNWEVGYKFNFFDVDVVDFDVVGVSVGFGIHYYF